LADQTGFPTTSVTKPITEPRSDPAKQAEQHRAPPKECADRGKKFQVTAPIASRGMTSFARNTGNVRYIVEHQHMTVGGDAIIAKRQRYLSIFAIINPNFIAMEQQLIFFTGKIFAPETFFGAHDEIGVVVAFCPRERRRPVELDPFSAKSDLSRFKTIQRIT
jgi:hypothetical protein